jgi:rRNA maturation endonuclease Nob1
MSLQYRSRINVMEISSMRIHKIACSRCEFAPTDRKVCPACNGPQRAVEERSRLSLGPVEDIDLHARLSG